MPASATQKLLHDFLLVQDDFQKVWPTPQIRNAAPGRIIFCDQMSEYRGLNPGGDDQPFREDDDACRIMYDAAWHLPSLVRAGGYPPWIAFKGGNQLQILYAHYFLKLMGERVPPWLDQGLGKLVRGMCCSENSIEFPALTTDVTLAIRKRGSEADLQAAVQKGNFLTLERLFSATQPPKAERPRVTEGRNGFYVVGPDHKSFWITLPFGTFVDESYELAQFCLFGEHGKYRAAFIKFALAASNGPLDEAGFKDLFGLDYHAMLLALWHYTDFGRDRVFPQGASIGTQPPSPPTAFRPATKPEIDRMETEWMSEWAGKGL